MWNAILELAGNSHFEAYVGGPLAGVIAGALFGASGGANFQQNQNQVDFYQIQQQLSAMQRQLAGNNNVRNHSRSSNGAGGEVFIFAALIGIIATFLFAAFLPIIALTLCSFILTVATFSIAAMFVGILKGRFRSLSWWSHALFPLITSVICLWVVLMATSAITADVTLYAQQLIGGRALSLAVVVECAKKFFQTVSSQYFYWILFDMAAFTFIGLAAYMSLMQCIHFIAVTNFSGGSSVWDRIAVKTLRFSGGGTMIFTLLMCGLAWFCASGRAFQFWLQSTAQ